MRVLFVTGEFPPMQGGVGDYTNELAKALGDCGVETDVLTSAGADPEPCVHGAVASWSWSSIPLIRRWIRETRADIVHIEYQTAAFGMHPAINFAPRALRNFAPLLDLLPGRPSATSKPPVIITTFHDLQVPYLFPKASPIRKWVTIELARASDAVVATNEEDTLMLSRTLYRPPVLIPIGSNIPPAPPVNYDRARWRSALGIRADELLLCYFGFLNESKGGTTLIQALNEIPQARLLMIGGQVGASDPTNAAYLARFKSLAADLGLSSRVSWTDYCDAAHVSANLFASDICVLPYLEGASFRRGSFMAALAHGLPIVTTSVPKAVPRLSSWEASTAIEFRQNGGSWGIGTTLPQLKDGHNVILVPPEDAHALAAAILQVASEPELRARLSSGALELAQQFTWDEIAAKHVELYNRVRHFAA